MEPDRSVSVKREQRDGWALNSQYMPTRVVGYVCPDDYWWCPAIGYSIPGSTLFATEAEAREAAIQRLAAERRSINIRLAELNGDGDESI